MRTPVLLVLLAALVASAPAAQVGFTLFNGRNHPEIDWQVAETEHFEIMYPAHLAGIEVEAAAIAEASLASLVQNMGDSLAVTFDDPIRIYLSDEDEIANGIAYNVGASGFTTIWVHVNDAATIWTGDVKWLRKVIAHELAHIVHYRAIRSNVGLLSVFFGDPLPSFWTEGLAQYLTERWDAQRGDRWLRTATFEDRLSYTDGTSPQNGRLRYAVGNSQVRYLAQTRGDSTLADLLAQRETWLGVRYHDFYAAFRETVGMPYRTFYEEWRKHVNVYYNTMAGQMERLDSLDAKPFRLPGQVVYDVAFSPDTSQVAAVVLPSLARPVRRLFVMGNPGADSTTGGLRILAEGSITGPVSWNPDGSQIAYARTRRGRHGSLVKDLYLVDVASGDRQRLTTDRRASSPSFGPDGRRLAFVGVEGGTANVFVLDLETREERPLTAFEGDVQIPTVRWSPAGARIAISLFDAEGRRDLATVDAETGAVERLVTGVGVAAFERDDRLPVWNAAGDSLAFTSLRDRAPNVFVTRGMRDEGSGMDEVAAQPTAQPDRTRGDAVLVTERGHEELGTGELAGAPTPPADLSPAPTTTASTDSTGAPVDPTSAAFASTAVQEESPSAQSPVTSSHEERSEERVTFLYDGATVHDWLPPDSLHPAGRLVLVASETKRRDRVFIVDASRRPTVEAGPVEVPEAYAAWTSHAPPLAIPDRIAPDPSLIRERRDYRPLRHLTHAITLALPYGDPGEDGVLFTDDDDWGAFANSIWLEPLGKHQLAVLAGVSVTRPVDKSFLLLSYVNRQLAPTLGLTLYRFPSPSSFYGSSILVEDLTGGDLTATLPLDVLDRPYASMAIGARLRYAFAEPLALDRFDDLENTGLEIPEDGTRFDVQLGAAYVFQRPYRWNGITPLDGTGLRARVTAGVPALGGDPFVRPDLQGYRVWPFFGRSRLFTQGRATLIEGQTLVQDYVGLARFDDIDVQVPIFGPLALDDAERVRGYRSYAVGTRALFGSVEVRTPILFDLQTTLLGFARLGPVAASVFADGGLVWTGTDLDNAVQRLGVGTEVSNLLSLGGFEIRHAVGLAVPATDLGPAIDGDIPFEDLDLYYRIQAAIPF